MMMMMMIFMLYSSKPMCVGFISWVGWEMSCNVDAVLRLHNIICTTGTRRFTPWG